MIRATLLSSRRSIWVMTLTSGLRASMVSRADSALYCPMRLVLCKIWRDRKSTRLNSSHSQISYAVFCLKKKIHDEHFARSLIYMCPHSSAGAISIVISHPAPRLSFPDFLLTHSVIAQLDTILLVCRAVH